jgi:replicative superfamily II helicase
MPPVQRVGDQDNLVLTSNYPAYANFPFEKFNPVQSRVFEFYNKNCNAIIAAATSAGKAQPNTTLVLTPNGYVPMGRLKIDDFVIGSDGHPVKIIGVFPQGEKDVYKVIFSDKTSTNCCEEHLWNVRTRSEKYRNKDFQTKSLKEILVDFEKDKFHIPFVDPIHFNNQTELGIHPYALGLLLGDGGFGYGAKLSCGDYFCVEKFSSLMPEDIQVTHSAGVDYRIVSGDCDQFNEVTFQLKEMCLLGKKTHEKFIPKSYKITSVENRIALLQGLMDSDGGGFSNKSPTFEVTSKELAYDVADIVRSLGGWTNVRVKNKTTYKYKGELRYGRPVYRLTIVLNNICPFSLPRKIDLWHERKRDVLKKIVSIEKNGFEECTCIKVQNTDGLYVTENYIVTHNTICAEMFMANEVRERGGKAMYLAPLRALAKEKIDDWGDDKHHFKDMRISICTGDYRLTSDRKKELANSNIILMTSEMLNSRCRNFNSEHNDWLKQVKTIVVDESHLLTVPGRGDHLEVGLMNFLELSPDARVIFLSATMPNVGEIADWVSYVLVKKETYLLESKYRPCPLGIHYESYLDKGVYDEQQDNIVDKALELVENYPDDKFLLFAHTKKTGEKLKVAMKKAGYETEFHNADLDKDKRHILEKRFRTGEIQYVIATSTLAWGLNLPARRVVILGVHRGIQEVDTYDIWQMAGRAGRPGYDPRGDVYILLPDSKEEKHRNRLKEHQKIESRLLDHVSSNYKILAFHLVSEIHHGRIKNKEDVHKWYERTLARFQEKDLHNKIVDSTIDSLLKCAAIKEEDGIYKVTAVGMVASMFYYSPYDVADLRRNFFNMFKEGKEHDDLWVSISLANVDSLRMGIVSRAEKDEIGAFQGRVWREFGKNAFLEPVIKAAYAYHALIGGDSAGVLDPFSKTLQWDYPRLSEVLCAIDNMGTKWNKLPYFKELSSRISYGVPSYLIPFVKLPEIGKVRAERLWNAGFRTLTDIGEDSAKVMATLNMKADRIKIICESARNLCLEEMFGI